MSGEEKHRLLLHFPLSYEERGPGGEVTASAALSDYLIASGLIGEPTAPVMGRGGATNMNS